MNLQVFFNHLRGSTFFPALTNKQVQGTVRLLDVWAQWYSDLPIQFLAAALTQIHHETGGRMHPVIETFSSTPAAAAQVLEVAYRKKRLPWVKKPYWHPDENGLIWIGRGDIQITHEPMYAALRRAIKDAFGVDIALNENPELALEPNVSAVIAFEGMTRGLFRPKKLADFFKNGQMDYVRSRDVVNGDSHDKEIIEDMRSGGALFEQALLSAGADRNMTASVARGLPGMNLTIKPGEMPAIPKPSNPGENRVRAIQERLHAHGYGELVGAIDGLYGPKTALAIQAFESSRNISLDHVDAATWEALQLPAHKGAQK